MVQLKSGSNNDPRIARPVNKTNNKPGANSGTENQSDNTGSITGSTTEERLARSPGTADTLTRDITLAEHIAHAPTTEERLGEYDKNAAANTRETAGFISLGTSGSLYVNPLNAPATLTATPGRTSQNLAVANVATRSGSESTSTEEAVLPELYIGDPPVADGWREERNTLFDEVRADFQLKKTEFQGSDAEFLASYTGEPNALLDRLAAHYEKGNPAELLESYPDLIEIAVGENRSENAGPGLNGQSMISGEVLIMIDMQLSDPDVFAMMEQIDGPLAPPTNAVARTQMYLYGEDRFEQIQKYHAVMQNVRTDYLDALHMHGRDRNSEFIARPSSEEMQAWETAHQALVDEGPAVAERASRAQFALSGPKPHEIYREYHDRLDASNDAKPRPSYLVDDMTDWYVQQDTPSARLFNAFFGPSTYDQVPDGSIRSSLATHEFAGGDWGIRYGGTEGGNWQYNTGFFVNDQVQVIDFDNLPELHQPDAIFFSPGAGWYTPTENLVRENHWLEDAVDIVIVGGVGLYLGGVGAGIGAGIGGVGGAIIGGMVGGGASAAFAGAYHGNFDWDDVWDGALTGGLTAGLSNIRALQQLAQTPAGAIATSTIIGGTVAELVDGEFEEGAINGLLAGISNQMYTDMNAAIDQSGLTGTEAVVARQAARVVSTAVRVANTDGHPGQVLAQQLLNDVIQQVGQPIYDAGFEWGFDAGVIASDLIDDVLDSIPIPSGGSAGGSTDEENLVEELIEALERRYDIDAQILDGAEALLEMASATSDHTGRVFRVSYFGTDEERAMLNHVHNLTGDVLSLAASNPRAIYDIFSLDGLADNTVQLGAGLAQRMLTRVPYLQAAQIFALSDFIWNNYNVVAGPIELLRGKD